jgi:hypothetical protein
MKKTYIYLVCVCVPDSSVIVRYHDDESKEFNACIRFFFLHIVYLYPKNKSLLFADNMYEINMHTYVYIYSDAFLVNPPFAPVLDLTCSPLPTLPFTYLEIPLLMLVVRISTHSRPWLAINCSPLAAQPPPPLQETLQIKLHIYIGDIITSAVPSDTVIICLPPS